MNTRENLWNVYCVVTNQKRDETAKDNRQTSACICHDLIRNNELAFSSNELAFHPRLQKPNLQKPNYRIWNRPRSEILQRCKFSFSATIEYGSKITNHSQLAWPVELQVKNTGQPCFWLVVFFSQTRCLALSDPIYSIQYRFPVNFSLNILFISVLCT